MKQIILELVQEFKRKDKFIKYAKDINCGDCADFAERLKERVPECEIFKDGEIKNGRHGFIHAYVRYRGLFYDSETPDGVSDWRLLPCYARSETFDSNIKRLGLEEINIPYRIRNG